MEKLQKYGFSPQFIIWIKSFLTNRPQSVVLDGIHSYVASIISGVPQGTVLGPILFIIFINDMEHCIQHSVVRFFADDSRVSKQISCEQDTELLQNDLDNIIKWSIANNMLVHEDKFELMIHKHKLRSTIYELPFISELMTYTLPNGKSISPVETLRDLGVAISSDLSWHLHISEIVKCARSVA